MSKRLAAVVAPRQKKNDQKNKLVPVVTKKCAALPKTAGIQSKSKGEPKKKKFHPNAPLKAIAARRHKIIERRIAKLILDHRENARKLARSILRRWRVRMPSEEIDSIVDLALCEAARRFSLDHGASFMTFFFYHLRGHLVRTVTRAAQASSMFLGLSQNGGVDPGDWPKSSAENIWYFLPETELFGQREVATPENEVLRKEKVIQCTDALVKLDKLEREIIKRSFAEEQPLVDIARSLGYSRCHVSRVKKTALDRMKVMLEGIVSSVTPVEDKKKLEVVVERITADRLAARRRARRRDVPAKRPIVSLSNIRSQAA